MPLNKPYPSTDDWKVLIPPLLALAVGTVLGIMSMFLGCSSVQPVADSFGVTEAGGDGFVRGYFLGHPFSVEVQYSAIGLDEDGDAGHCPVTTVEMLGVKVRGVPETDAIDPRCVEKFGALPNPLDILLQQSTSNTDARASRVPQDASQGETPTQPQPAQPDASDGAQKNESKEPVPDDSEQGLTPSPGGG